MNSEQLKKVEEIYHAVLEVSPQKRELLLQDYCGADEELRREIDSLLSFDKTFGNVIDSSPEFLINEIFASFPTLDLIGSQINQYKILALLGEGGMGTVYLAQDTKLERRVAVKFLSDRFPGEGNGLSRFFLEAKASSALNHPNIITVHEIGEFAGKPFIATEFIDGVTLKKFLSGKKQTLGEILDITIQITSALSSAHKAGIIHRDIKPDNIMVRRDGIVKVLDFGLAKLIQETAEIDSETVNRTNISTIHGVVLGTPQFMSPEQVRGKKVDKRTDIWSFGVLLYELFTQKLPFQGETTPDVVASILKSEPLPLTDYVSGELERITLLALKKNRDERYQTIEEISTDLKTYRRELEFGNKTESLNFRIDTGIEHEKKTNPELTPVTVEEAVFQPSNFFSYVSQTISKPRRYPAFSSFILIFAASLLVVLGFVYSKQSSSADQADSFQQMKLAKLTFDGTATNIVAVSPDGRYIVYALQNENKQTLMLRQAETSSTVQLVPAAEVSYQGLTFTPNGSYVYYTVYENGAGNVYEIPVLGGNSRKIINDVDGKVTFSPDGKTIAFVRTRNSLILADAKGGSERILKTSDQGEIRVLAEWSPDGASILTSVFSKDESRFYLTEISVTAGIENRFSALPWMAINGLAWLPDKSGIMIVGRDPETKFSQLWQISYPTGKPQRITNDFSTYVGLNLTADGKSIVTIKQERLYNIWTASAENQVSAKKITIEEGRDDGISGVSQTRTGNIVYTVRIKDAFDIWIVNADGSGNRQLTFDQGTNFNPTVSPDNQSIVFTSSRTGKAILWRMDIDGGNPTALTEPDALADYASFTPDGKWIIYRKSDSNNLSAIWKLNLETRKTIRLTESEAWKPTVSPDGKFFACQYGSGKTAKVAIISIEGGKPEKIVDAPAVLKSKVFRWTKDGKSLIYIDKSDRINNLQIQSLDNTPPKQLTFFESGQIERFDLTADGKSLVFSRGTESSDIVLFDNFR